LIVRLKLFVLQEHIFNNCCQSFVVNMQVKKVFVLDPAMACALFCNIQNVHTKYRLSPASILWVVAVSWIL